MAELAKAVFAAQGHRAFEAPRWHAAVHEAGHAVIHRLAGDPVRTVHIWREDEGIWSGRTDAGAAWSVTPETQHSEVKRRAHLILAGWAAELVMLGSDMRAGSSLDELAVFRSLATGAAVRDGADPRRLMLAWMDDLLSDLARHRRPLHRVAIHLHRRRRLEGKSLRRLLAPVQRDGETRTPRLEAD